jgi:ribulose-phosphate 3-epimerase
MHTGCELLPGILAYSEADFKAQLLYPGLKQLAPTFHVDILDGSMFGAKCWADPSIVGQWANLPAIEIHCMVSEPDKHIEAWHKHVPSLKRAIIHQHTRQATVPLLKQLNAYKLELGLAINPHDSIERLPAELMDVLMLMGVEPGKSGQSFLGEPILAKIRRGKKLYPGLKLALDGGISFTTVTAIMQAGANRLVASSAIWKEENPLEACQNLLEKLT